MNRLTTPDPLDGLLDDGDSDSTEDGTWEFDKANDRAIALLRHLDAEGIERFTVAEAFDKATQTDDDRLDVSRGTIYRWIDDLVADDAVSHLPSDAANEADEYEII